MQVACCFADSQVTVRGTVTNQGNVKLQNLRWYPTPNITEGATPVCTLSAASDVNPNVEWHDQDVPVGYKVVCAVTYTIGQDALETTVTSSSGAPEVHVQLFVNATATQDQIVMTGNSLVVVPVAQTASLAVQIMSELCAVPEEPGVCQWQRLWQPLVQHGGCTRPCMRL